MKYLIRAKFVFLFLLAFCFIHGQPNRYTTANAHSHNDYLNDSPFYRAFKNGYGSIEADVFPVNGILCVAHSKKEIQPARTLNKLYLNPLLQELSTHQTFQLKLLVDIKEAYALSLDLLIKELEPLVPYLSTLQESKPLIIIISGSRPPPNGYSNYPPFIFFDADLKVKHSPAEWERVGLVSLPFTKLSSWKGEKNLKKKEKKIIRHIIDSVHGAGKMIRFWAAPDTTVSWLMQMKFGVDLIGTDKIDALADFIRKKKRSKFIL